MDTSGSGRGVRKIKYGNDPEYITVSGHPAITDRGLNHLGIYKINMQKNFAPSIYISDGAKLEIVINRPNRSFLCWDNDTGLAPTIL